MCVDEHFCTDECLHRQNKNVLLALGFLLDVTYRLLPQDCRFARKKKHQLTVPVFRGLFCVNAEIFEQFLAKVEVK